MKKLVVLFSGLLLAVACGDDAPKNSTSNNNPGGNNGGNNGEMLVKPGTTEACGLAGRVGETDCFDGALTCQAGQYCNQEMLVCSVGCTSDNNCASNQFCDLGQGSPGTCLNCVVFTPQPSNNTPSNNTPVVTNNAPNNPPTGVSAACETIVNAGVTCELIASGDAALAKTFCTQEDPADVNLLLTCINSAAGDCAQIESCGGGDDSCEEDFECDDTPGQLHEICSGGSCQIGCRESTQCGQDFICDLDLAPGSAGVCVPDF